MDLHHAGEIILQDPVLFRLSRLARGRRVPLFLVGGYVRDLLLGTPSHDYDLILSSQFPLFITAIEESLGFRFFVVGKEEAGITYRIVKNDLSVDLTFFQGRTLEEDLQRRDFTINAIAFSLRDETFHQVEGSFEDIEKRVIRTITNTSLERDPLRMLRAIRYVCNLEGFELDGKVLEEISLKKKLIERMPGERIKMEMDKILLSPRMARGIGALRESGLLLTLFPELKGLQSLKQGHYHHMDALSHTLLAVEKLSWAVPWLSSRNQVIPLSEQDRLALHYAALFHDLGKQDTYSEEEKGRIHFYDHEVRSCEAAEKIMERFRFSNALRDKTLRLVKDHMRILSLSPATKETALRRLANRIGDLTPLLVIHTLADKEASRGFLSFSRDDVVEHHCLRILDLFRNKEIIHPPPLVSGRDVIALGYHPGPEIGRILKMIQDKQVAGRIRTRDEALKLLRRDFGQDHS